MGYKTREKTRRKRIATSNAQARSRKSGSATTGWWLTIVRVDTCCARCAKVLRRGREMVYRHTPREALCVVCASCDPESAGYKVSLAWEKKQGGRRRHRGGRLAA